MAFLVGVVTPQKLEIGVSIAAILLLLVIIFLLLASKQGDLLGLNPTGGINTPLALLGVQEAFVTFPTEERNAITFSPPHSILASYTVLFSMHACIVSQATPTDICIIHAAKFSNTTSMGKNLNFNQVRGNFTLLS